MDVYMVSYDTEGDDGSYRTALLEELKKVAVIGKESVKYAQGPIFFVICSAGTGPLCQLLKTNISHRLKDTAPQHLLRNFIVMEVLYYDAVKQHIETDVEYWLKEIARLPSRSDFEKSLKAGVN